MTKLYGRMSAGDHEGLVNLVEGAATPFQKALGVASIEHIMIQARLPEAAEQYAKQIPMIDSDCFISKGGGAECRGCRMVRSQ